MADNYALPISAYVCTYLHKLPLFLPHSVKTPLAGAKLAAYFYSSNTPDVTFPRGLAMHRVVSYLAGTYMPPSRTSAEACLTDRPNVRPLVWDKSV